MKQQLQILRGKLLVRYLLCLFFMAGGFTGSAQAFASQQNDLKDVIVSIRLNDARVEKILKEIEDKTNFRFAFDLNLVKNTPRVSLDVQDKNLLSVLEELSAKSSLSFKQINNTIHVSKSPLAVVQTSSEVANPAVLVTGKVVDETGGSLPGASVVIEGQSSVGTVTDLDGNYSIEAEVGDVLVFSFMGYENQKITVGSQSIINVTMSVNLSSLEEVIVVGYGTRKKVSLIGAVDQVGQEALEGRPVATMSQALQGVSANLIVQQRNSEPGAGVNLNIRGISTLGDNSPLVVIDGVIGGDINLLNPSDIESVSVLKDAGSAAIYGSRANNGVVLITTKQGKKNSRPMVTYNGLVGVNTPQFFTSPVHGYQNAMLRNEAAFNAGRSEAIFSPEEIRQIQQNGDTEWFAKEIFDNAVQQNHNITVSGGGENSTYLVSAGYTDQQSNFVGPAKGYKRLNYRMNLTNEFGRFKLSSRLAYSRRLISDHSFSSGTLMADANRVPLYYTQKDSEGRYLTNDILQEFNPLGILEQGGFREHIDDNVFGNLSGEFRLTDHFKVRGVFGFNMYSNNQYARVKEVEFYPRGIYGGNRNTNDENRKGMDLNTQVMMDYARVFSEVHDLSILLGVSNENHTDRGIGIYKTFTDPDLGTPVTETVISPDSYNSNQSSSENSLYSAFGSASYDYKKKYFAEVSFRYDGSSKFREGKRWGFFPSASLGYRLSEEAFMSGYRSRVGDLKIRSSYGVLGNQNVGNYQYQTTFFTYQNAYGFNNAAVGGTGFNYANPNIQWERAATFNIGADLDFMDGALTLSLDYFDKITSDILVPPAVPGVFGTSLPDFNSGKVRNRGWEITTTYRHRGQLFNHSFTFNLGDSQNEVLDFQGNERLTGLEELQVLLKEGYPFNSYVGLKRDGYFQNIDEVESGPKPEGLNVQPGDNRYVDVDGNGIINDDDNYVFGNPFPRLTFGLTYNVKVKGFDLNIFAQGVGRRTMMIRGEIVEPFHFNYGMTMYTHQLDYWTPQNPDARYPILAENGSQSNTNNFRRGSDMYLYDGAYLRLKNVQLGYTLPQPLAEKVGMQTCRAYLSGQNLFTLSKVKFVDPELSEFDNSMRSGGANSARAYPTMVYYGFGLDITF
ncbi:TonB-linked SusC/RagA family outer membrane protein [Algoriphagus sp. 4150]|uniref:TonB-dependent receptor n=1 Tax=Algoriphagus sp. 4150 TaxID=2817756 RepID=UPI00285AB937|nr:TonB-dependent receptor [Algoriphagus sp. 4150]MDR7130296.1 TonB-linked SusC/RagA family outer membrane protein [Algoriphagus sp. 4150]